MITTVQVEELKICRDCKMQFPLSTFPKVKSSKGEYRPQGRCSKCLAAFRASYRVKKEKSLYKTCRDCKKQDLYENFPKQKNASGNYYALPRCSECHNKARVEYRKENRDSIASYSKQWFATHPEYKRGYREKKHLAYKLELFYKNAAERNLSVELPEIQLLSMFQQPCYFCGCHDGLNGIDRLDPRMGYLKTNVVTACSRCNFGKQSLTEQEFYNWIDSIVEHRKSKGNTFSPDYQRDSVEVEA